MSVSVAFDKIRRVIVTIDCDPEHEVFFFYRLFCGGAQRYRAPGGSATAGTLYSEVSLALSKFLEDELSFLGRARLSRADMLAEIEKQFELCVWYTLPTDRLIVLTSTDDPARHLRLLEDAPPNARIANTMRTVMAEIGVASSM